MEITDGRVYDCLWTLYGMNEINDMNHNELSAVVQHFDALNGLFTGYPSVDAFQEGLKRAEVALVHRIELTHARKYGVLFTTQPPP